MTEPWNFTEAQRMQFREAHAEAKHTSIPEPGVPQCQADGVRNGPDGPGGTDQYWTCTAPGTITVDGTLLCDDHAGERGYGPKQEEYGYDPDPEESE